MRYRRHAFSIHARHPFSVPAPRPDTTERDNPEAILGWAAAMLVVYAAIAAAAWYFAR